ncbi:MAG: hypothetical protein GTO45_33265 [Candidatus Aminicenantes bacterium]|nr:hypothetical protein [Candidatus Aminicenantes bacterium]NIM83606.1 hypothetical protein [Candidatus Aminicenantes bacterium]NIN23010.1 hypothetical protein [Candidatus Aminicenantes bacterium]NIN46747.1 hypothetical protein [Candidatus Aminicenantes bacterium]NIN89654.1 hypothetical protein [Candidatus Aminicenantes bacterium]
MRRFSSYGPINTKLHYYAPREELINQAYTNLIGGNPDEGGHYITVWAPRQCGKTWIVQEVVDKIKQTASYACGIFSIERGKKAKTEKAILQVFTTKLTEAFGRKFPAIKTFDQIPTLFTKPHFQEPVILIIDEFDALNEGFINDFASMFRDIFISRTNEKDKPTREKTYLLHGLVLVGVRSVLGTESKKGSPFNVQRSLHIPNLTKDEVKGMFQWYEKESRQTVDEEVIDRLFYETNGQPGLTCWFGELLTETYNKEKEVPIIMANFKYVYKEATDVLPNNNILNIISKVKPEPYRQQVLELFKTDKKIEFRFDDEELNYLYMNGVIDIEREKNQKDELEVYCKFANPFVQGRLFNYFSREMFDDLGLLIHPLDEMEDAVSEDSLNIPNIIKRYKAYLKKNRESVFKEAPRRKVDLKVYEAVYHFNLYRYLYDLLKKRGVDVIPEFLTGNGKIDLVLKYREQVYALELKSFRDMYDYRRGIEQAADYGKQLGLKEIVLLVFVELKEEEVKELEQEIEKPGIKMIVIPIGVL